MKGEKKNVGWLFPLQGGPHHGVEVRLPWPRLVGSGNKRQPDSDMYDQLPDVVPFPDGSKYEKQLMTYKSGKSKGELRTLKNGKPMWQYVYVPPLVENADVRDQ